MVNRTVSPSGNTCGHRWIPKSPGIFASTLRADYPTESVKDYLAMKLTAEPSAAGVSMLRETYSALITAGEGDADLISIVPFAARLAGV